MVACSPRQATKPLILEAEQSYCDSLLLQEVDKQLVVVHILWEFSGATSFNIMSTSQAPVLAVQLHSNHELGQHLLNLHVRLNCRDSLVQSTAEAQGSM